MVEKLAVFGFRFKWVDYLDLNIRAHYQPTF